MYEKKMFFYVGDSGVDMQQMWPKKKKWSFNDDILTRIIMIRQVKLQ